MRSSKQHPPTPLRLAFAICILALSAPPALLAGPAGDEAEIAAPARAGWRVYLDPETGELTSTPSREQVESLSEKIRSEETPAKSLEPAASRSSAGLEPFVLERGGRGVFLQGRFQSALVARRRDDGGFELVCADDAGHAEDALAEPPSPASQQWVEK